MIYPRLSDGTIDWCVMCKHEGRSIFDGCGECEYTENSDDPPTKYEPKPMTNGDRIRSMSDEELASKLELIQLEAVKAYGNDELLLAGELYEYWRKWLKQEADT